MLEVLNVDWNVSENAKSHNTDKYELSQSIPIFRRSQPFKLSITFNREFNEIMDNVRIILKHEISKDVPKLQSLLEDTTVMSSNKINRSKNHWSTQLVGQNDKTITILVRSPPIAAWGLWNLLIKISHKLDPKIITWKCPSQFWLLFNPWDKDDEVYMPDTRYLDEYILNDVGKVYTKGGLSKPKGMHWVYGQFAQPILPVLNKMVKEYKNYLDEEQQLDEEGLGSPLKLCKALMNGDKEWFEKESYM